MKKILFATLMFCCFCGNVFAQSGQPALENKDSWTMIVLPDPQTYIKNEINQPIFSIMTRWIKKNKKKLNIGLVMCEGDLVEQNNIAQADGISGDQTSLQQWKNVSESLGILDTIVPYIVCTGNHDYGTRSSENRYSQLNSFFPIQKMKETQKILAGRMKNAQGEKTLENAYYEFIAPDKTKFLILSLEFDPRDTIVQQAKEIIARKRYKDYKQIVMTHSYMKSMADHNERIKKDAYKLKDVTYGEFLWQKLISQSENIEMVFCGHIAGTNGFEESVGYRKDLNKGKKMVHQILFNAQADGGGWQGNGGDGWLRILEFLPDHQTVIVKTFSPFFAASPSTIDQAWRNAPYDHFKIKLAK